MTLRNTFTLPGQAPASQETTGDHGQLEVSSVLVTLEAD
jgi:hypothetical protein